MSAVTRPTGVVLDLDPGVAFAEVRAAPHAPAVRGFRSFNGPAPVPRLSVLDPLVAGLADQQLVVVDSFDLEGKGGARVGLAMADDEVAVVLLEQDGLYNWVYPDRKASARTGGHLKFEVDAAPPQQRGMRGPIVDAVLGRVRAYVLKFVVRIVGRAALKAMESHRQEGLVIMNGSPSEWSLVGSAEDMRLPRDRPARLLLFLHGAFSSTRGDFGSLALSKPGAAWLADVRQSYDAILGYDHRTLSADPLENATDLAARLARLTDASEVDVVGYSRGVLVLRSLVELFPPKAWSGRVRRAVLVGAPNAGTRLADPKRWEHLADLYTNLASLGCKALSLFTPAAAAAAILKESISSLAAFVNYLASVALDQRVAPGLAALSPASEFLAKLNHAGPAACDYYLVQSNFDVQLLAGDSNGTAFPRRLALWLIDVLADAFMGLPNDLLVDTASMAAGPAGLVKDQLCFGPSQQVHHGTYFARRELTEKIGRWLCVESTRHKSMSEHE